MKKNSILFSITSINKQYHLYFAKFKPIYGFLALLLLFFYSCSTPNTATSFDFPKPVDTSNRPIQVQEKKVYQIGGVYADNQFDGARLNNFIAINDSTFQATIRPENTPINPSAWYAFRLWSDSPRRISLVLNYEDGWHRYSPKISRDGETWELLDSTLVEVDTVNATLSLSLDKNKLWLAGQELENSSHVKKWCENLATHADVDFETIGKSVQDRPLYCLHIGSGASSEKPSIVVLSRQHPPEVSGYLAMKAFVEALIEDNPLANDFRKKYNVLVFPLMNPDGVDMGHWRHNAGGIDLNRDWAYYRQAETRQIADFIVATAKQNKSEVILGLDFHSTYKDVYYTNKMTSSLSPFKDYWLMGIDEAIDDYDINEKPSNVGRPVSKAWFFEQFNAEGITYEIGDNTPRPFIKKKGRISAIEMMQLLVYRK